MKDKVNAFIRKLPSIMLETLIFIICSFLGILINLFIAYGYIKYINPQYTMMQLVKSDEILFGILSTIIGVLMSVCYYYFNSIRKRKIVSFVTLLTLIVSTIISIIVLIQSQSVKFFDHNILTKSCFISIIIMFFITIFFKYDEAQAMREYEIQKKANENSSIDNGTIGERKVKV